MWWIIHQQTTHTPECTPMKGGGIMDDLPQRIAQLPLSDGYTIFSSYYVCNEPNISSNKDRKVQKHLDVTTNSTSDPVEGLCGDIEICHI